MRLSMPALAIFTTVITGADVPTSAQETKLESAVAGERRAADAESLGVHARASAAAAIERHEYALDADGKLTVRVVTLDGMGEPILAVAGLYFVRDGRIAAQAVRGADGLYTANGLSPGYYSVIAAGPRGVSAIAARVVPSADQENLPTVRTISGARTASPPGTPSGSLQLVVSTIPPIDVPATFYLARRLTPIQNAVRTPFAPSGRRNPLVFGGRATPRSAPSHGGAALSAARSGAARNAAARTEATGRSEATADAAVVTADVLEAHETYRFPLNDESSFGGWLRMVDATDGPTPAQVRLYLLRQGRVVLQADVDGAGRFSTGRVEPGYYSLVAVGPSGMAAAGVQLLSRNPPTGNRGGFARTVSTTQVPPVNMNLAPIPTQDIGQLQLIAQQEGAAGAAPPPGNSSVVGGGATGGGGGGGAGGGGGGLGGLGSTLLGSAMSALSGIGSASEGGGSTSITTTTSNSPTAP